MKIPKEIPKTAFNFVTNHKRVFMIAVVVVTVAAFSLISVIRFGGSGDNITSDGEVSESNVNPDAIELVHGTDAVSYTAPITTMSPTTAAASSTAETKEQATRATRKPRSRTAATTERPVPFATAAVPDHPADYQAQWDAGYLLAIDNPDTSYSTSTVELSDADRDLLERLCMGEFGSGGFIGAALIAQAVKDAMCSDGYSSVADVIKYCRYDGSTSMGTNDACRQAVRYIFDDNHAAVQHRLLYMYNPYLCTSSFHESQRFILSYQGVRFFDRW